MTRASRRLVRLVLVGVLPTLLVVAGCSFSHSSKGSSNSSGASSESSSSSSPGANARAYQQDVSDYTAAYVKSSNDFTAFQSGVANLARKRGITDWENDTDTWRGVGAGLGRGGVSRVQLDVYKENLAGGDAAHAAAIEQGYDSVK